MIIEKVTKTTNYNSATKNINLVNKTKKAIRKAYEKKRSY